MWEGARCLLPTPLGTSGTDLRRSSLCTHCTDGDQGSKQAPPRGHSGRCKARVRGQSGPATPPKDEFAPGKAKAQRWERQGLEVGRGTRALRGESWKEAA